MAAEKQFEVKPEHAELYESYQAEEKSLEKLLRGVQQKRRALENPICKRCKIANDTPSQHYYYFIHGGICLDCALHLCAYCDAVKSDAKRQWRSHGKICCEACYEIHDLKANQNPNQMD